MDIAARTAAFFAAVTAQDADALAGLCAPGFRMKQNNGPERDLETALAGLRGLWALGVTTEYSDIRRAVAERVVTEQHLVTLTRDDGRSARGDVCVVVRFDEQDAMLRLDEYADSSVFAALFS